ncbi:GNAT family N-acetyltransferase [Dyella marensis]|jgi:GNAT superfamily N-acetyltransferase|uniref:Ribosomal protein S18 acetylase RimI n=1 Tax=Dyella marensis TaxID=500610 RepID=A0A1I2DB91_9GAMM|nr:MULTISPECIES: GNAT family N-acetyltransferase [Dyella]SFE77787.1 Ribosomal protein S18 acetylase RimI [Dyella marensis]
MSIIVRQATIHDLDLVAPLFDAYRQFYAQPADLALARRFLEERFRHAESVVLLALNEATGEGVGFTQLYPLFSSVRATRRYLLNDLFVTPEKRRFGVAAALLHAATAHARAMGMAGMSLSTANDNLPAQRLYESMGWQLDSGFREYHLTL